MTVDVSTLGWGTVQNVYAEVAYEASTDPIAPVWTTVGQNGFGVYLSVRES